MTLTAAVTSWAEASIWIAIILGIALVLAVGIHATMRVGRSAVEADGSGSSRHTSELLAQMAGDLGDVRMRLAEVERMLKDV